MLERRHECQSSYDLSKIPCSALDLVYTSPLHPLWSPLENIFNQPARQRSIYPGLPQSVGSNYINKEWAKGKIGNDIRYYAYILSEVREYQ